MNGGSGSGKRARLSSTWRCDCCLGTFDDWVPRCELVAQEGNMSSSSSSSGGVHQYAEAASLVWSDLGGSSSSSVRTDIGSRVMHYCLLCKWTAHPELAKYRASKTRRACPSCEASAVVCPVHEMGYALDAAERYLHSARVKEGVPNDAHVSVDLDAHLELGRQRTLAETRQLRAYELHKRRRRCLDFSAATEEQQG